MRCFFSNLSIIPTNCLLYDGVIWNFAVLMDIPLLLLECNTKEIWKETGRMMVIFLVGSASTVTDSFVACYLLHSYIPKLEAVAAMMTGSYIDDGVNSTAPTTNFNAGEIADAVTVADNLLMALYFFALIFLICMNFFRKHYSHPHIDAVLGHGDLQGSKRRRQLTEAVRISPRKISP